MTKDEALKLALEALDCIYSPLHVREINKVGAAMTAIREALAQPEQEEIEQVMLEVWQDVGDPRFPHIAQPEQEPVVGTKTWFEDGKVVTQYLHPSDIYKDTEQEPWPDEPAGHTDGGVQPSKMTKSNAITAIYSLFNAPHNADINLTGLNKVLDELMAQPEQEPVAWEDLLGAIARGWTHPETEHKTMDVPLAIAIAKEVQALYTTPPQRKPLTDEEIAKLADDFLAYQIEDYQVSGVFTFARAIEAAHGIKE